MNARMYDYESLQFFRQNAQRFPMTTNCLESGKALLHVEQGSTCGEDAEDEKTRMRIIGAGRQDEQSCYIICRIAAVGDGVIRSFAARVEDGDGREVTRAHFVSFETNSAFVRLIIPAAIFHQCRVFMEAASISETCVDVEKQGGVSLEDLYVEQIEASYRIGAPVITRKGIQADRIEITYYDRGCDKEHYDYVYHGRNISDGTDQMYLDSYGSIMLEDIELDRADAVLTVSKGKDKYGSDCPGKKYPGKVKIEVKGSYISYQFERKWEGVKVTECLGSSGYAMVDYLLEIEAVTAQSEILYLIITNKKELLAGGTDSHIKEILPIHAYVDCFGEGTVISMADGSRKAVEEIQAGELVATKEGNASVREIGCGGEGQVLSIYLDKGEELNLTAGHAVNTVDGIYPAIRLREGQQVVTENGVGTIRQILPRCDRSFRVYHLCLEEGAQWLYAGGTMVYSEDGEELFRERDWVREQLPEEWWEDYDNAVKAGLIYGK